MEVYVSPEVAAIETLHPYLKDRAFRALPIREQLARQADALRAAHASGDQRVLFHLLSWWPAGRGLSGTQVIQSSFSSNDARLAIAREYGFKSWNDVEALGGLVAEPEFESALDELLSGDIRRLQNRLVHMPALTKQRSSFGHRATLLHYLGANGVESHRQRVPLNAAELAQLLIEHGADLAAEANMYGGGQTPIALSESSAHPANAGIADELNRVLSGE